MNIKADFINPPVSIAITSTPSLPSLIPTFIASIPLAISWIGPANKGPKPGISLTPAASLVAKLLPLFILSISSDIPWNFSWIPSDVSKELSNCSFITL